MQQILHNYKLRLTNISQGNRALKLGKLSARKDIDWTNIGFLEGESSEILFQKVLAGKTVRLINKLDARFEATNIVDKRLNQIYRTAESIFEETGKQDLYVGYPFVEGKFADGTIVRCPVLLFPVQLIRNLQNRPRWALQVAESSEIQFNPTFFLAYEQYQKVRINPAFWEEVLDYQENWQDFLLKLYECIKKYEIEVNFNSDLYLQKLEHFPDLLKETMENFPLGKLIFRPYSVLGIFPQSDSALMQDYEVIQNKRDYFSFSSIFKAQNQELTTEKLPYVPEEKRFFVSEIDASQEDVLLKVKSGKSLVVHGPPGTGKSQVIVNMIADALMEGKKILLVSQKRAALDVVYKRLSGLGLGSFIALVHDSQADRQAIFHKIKQQIEYIPTFQGEISSFDGVKAKQAYEILAKQVDDLSFLYESLYQALTKTRSFGSYIHDLYQKCEISSPKFPLEKIAPLIDIYSLQRMVSKFHEIWAYAEFLNPKYIWYHRLSFHLYQYEDKQILNNRLEKIPAQISELHHLFTDIADKVGKNILNITENAKKIAIYRKADTILQDDNLKKAIENIYKDELEADFIRKNIDSIGKSFSALSKCRLIDRLSWSSCLELLEKIKIYNKNESKNIRFFNIKYLQAIWFINHIFKDKNEKWTEDSFQLLTKESEDFYKLWNLWTQTHHLAFFEDFPLDKIFKNVEDWLAIKEKQFEAWQFISQINDFSNYHPHFNFGVFDIEKWNKSQKMLRQFEEFQDILVKTENDWNIYLHENQIFTLKKEIENNSHFFAQKLQESLKLDFEELKILDTYFANLSEKEKETWQIVESGYDNFSLSTFDIQLINSFYFYWIQKAEIESPVLLEVSSRIWDKKQEKFSVLLTEKREKVAAFILQHLKERICNSLEYNRLQNPITFRDIYHQVSKKRRVWTLRKLVQETWDKGLNLLIPCCLASPESVSALFNMQKDIFDLVIFDEASQCFVEKAVPVMLRGKQIVVAGDSKQLQPFDMYSVKYEEADFSDSELALEVESVLDLAKANLEDAKLLWHYRSKEAALINFSNHFFYEGKLQIVPQAKKQNFSGTALEWISVLGKWEANCNLAEGEAVISLILKLIEKENPPSIGIVTFNYFQQELIKDLIDKKSEELAISNHILYEKLQYIIHKTENEEYVGLFVKNIENVQGDERDIIIFSVGYAKNDKGKLVSNFGLLNLQGGENRLNVAITRAKYKVYVLCSFQPNELQVENSKHNGPKLLKCYLQYVKAFSEGNLALTQEILQTQNSSSPTLSAPNPIADYIENELRKRGYDILRNFGDTHYKIDIAVKQSIDSQAFLLAIECEGSHYFSGISAKEREVYRLKLLEQKGWKFHRVWARNFWLSREKELERILQML